MAIRPPYGTVPLGHACSRHSPTLALTAPAPSNPQKCPTPQRLRNRMRCLASPASPLACAPLTSQHTPSGLHDVSPVDRAVLRGPSDLGEGLLTTHLAA
jgi:hypothetical protein